MPQNCVRFSIAKHAQWAPGLESDQSWQNWLQQAWDIQETDGEPPAVKAMPAMLRRRARLLGRMALEVAYACMDEQANNPASATNHAIVAPEIPTIFCSQHGEVGHSIELMQAQIAEGTVSPIGFSSAVHNATAGLFSIARKDRSNHIAIAAGASTVEHAVIEACALLNEGAKAVLLVNYEQALPALFHHFEDCTEQAYAWAWLIVASNASTQNNFCLEWKTSQATPTVNANLAPPGLAILRFQLGQQASLTRQTGNQQWIWSRDAIAA